MDHDRSAMRGSVAVGLFAVVAPLWLLIVGSVWVVGGMGRSAIPPGPAQVCPACGRPVEPGWRHCLACGVAPRGE